MAYRLEYKSVATYDKDGNLTQWGPFFPLGVDDDGRMAGLTHKTKKEIMDHLMMMRGLDSPLLRSHVFRIVVTNNTGDLSIINNVLNKLPPNWR